MDDHGITRRPSPQWTPRPLRPSPWNTPRQSPRSASSPDSPLEPSRTSPLYLTAIQRPVQEPNELLHDFYNVAPVPFRFEPDGSVPPSVEMPLVRRTDCRPTHALAILSSLRETPIPSVGLSARSVSPLSPLPSPNRPSSPYSPVYAEPLLLPIDAPLFAARFGHDVARTLGQGLPQKPSPLLRWDPARGTHLVTLPLIPLYVPHPPSMPHLLLFGQGLPTSSAPTSPLCTPQEVPNYSRPSPALARPSTPVPRSSSSASASTLATYLLPVSAIEEFPSAPAMAELLVRACSGSDDAFHAHLVFNQGLWRNVLLLAPTDARVVDVVRVAWNVTADARRLRERDRVQAAFRAPVNGRLSVGAKQGAGSGLKDERPLGRGVDLPALSVQYVEAGIGPHAHDGAPIIHLAPVPPSRRPGRRRSNNNLHM